MSVNGRNYTSNSSKLLKHLDKLELLQDGIPTGPVMVHLALTNNCNLNCSYCCYGGRTKSQELSLGEALAVIDGFSTLGSTVKNRPNDWSSTGTDGDPIMIIRNGQGINPGNGWQHITEDINKDLGSIYFGSTQKIPLEASSTLYDSYPIGNSPINPNEYTNNQIIINSGRVVINTFDDHILLTSKKSVNLNAVESVNMKAKANR